MKRILIISVLLCFEISSQSIDCEKVYLSKLPFDYKQKQFADIWKDKTTGFIYFTADYNLDMDGSPNAYSKDDKGIDYLENGIANGLAKDSNEEFCVQKETDARPGFYVSQTSLNIKGYNKCDYRRYVNSEAIPYFVFSTKFKVPVGAIGLIYNIKTKKKSFAIFADSNNKIIGEGSLYLAKELGIDLDTNSIGKIVGGEDKANIIYIVFPKSGLETYSEVTVELIDKLGDDAIKDFTGKDEVINYILNCK